MRELAAFAVAAAALAIVFRRPWSARARGHERVLFVGVSPLMTQLAAEIAERPALGWRIVGLVADRPHPPMPGVGPWLGGLRTLAGLIEATEPTLIVTAPADRRKPAVEGPLIDARLRGLTVEDTVRALEHATGKIPIESLSPRALLLSEGFRNADVAPPDSLRAVRHAVRVCLAAVGLLVTAPLFGLIALAIVLESGRPIFFVQSRVGIGGRVFPLLKFRTMRTTTASGSLWARDNADRITKVGRWLRRFRFDELPQLVNVLRGDMAIVGPRPLPHSNYALFMEKIPYFRLRSAVRPGITGWAQIKYGYANGLEEETEKMRYDLYYIKHRSLW